MKTDHASQQVAEEEELDQCTVRRPPLRKTGIQGSSSKEACYQLVVTVRDFVLAILQPVPVCMHMKKQESPADRNGCSCDGSKARPADAQALTLLL